MVLRLVVEQKPPPDEQRTIRHGRQLARRDREKRGWFTKTPDSVNNLVTCAVLWLAPWHADHYPGRLRLIQAVLGRSRTQQAVSAWRTGKALIPPWAARALASGIRTRCEAGLALVAELEAHADWLEANPVNGANLRAMRAAGLKPSGLGARGRMAADPAPPE